jgi:HD superfamily phosphohydrolase
MESKPSDEQEIRQQKIDRSRKYTNCLATAAMAINKLHNHGRLLDQQTIIAELTKSSNRVKDGNITEIEQILMTQAKMLDYIFYDSLNHLADLDMVNQVEAISNIAFRAQSQCRKTLSTLAELKHPRRVMFVKQLNNAVNQQINNHGDPDCLEFKNSKKIANKVLKETNLEKMDAGRAPDTVTINQEAEAVATLNRS